MHELSLAQGIIDIVKDHVPEFRRPAVRAVRVRVGVQSGVVCDSLSFCFAVLAADGPFRSAVLVIEEIPFLLRCELCGTESTGDSGIPLCPSCGAAARILSGTELQVRDIELDEPEENAR